MCRNVQEQIGDSQALQNSITQEIFINKTKPTNKRPGPKNRHIRTQLHKHKHSRLVIICSLLNDLSLVQTGPSDRRRKGISAGENAEGVMWTV